MATFDRVIQQMKKKEEAEETKAPTEDDAYNSLHWGDQETIDLIMKRVGRGDYPKTEQGIKKALRDFGGMNEKATEVLYKRLGVTPTGKIKNTLVDDMIGATPDPRRWR